MNGFLPELQAKTKVDMQNMYREKHRLTCESLVLPGLLLLSNIETDRGYLGKRRACNNLWKKKNKPSDLESTIKNIKWIEKTGFVKKITEKVSDIRFMCNINYTWILQLPHTDGSVEDPEIKNQTLCLLLFD